MSVKDIKRHLLKSITNLVEFNGIEWVLTANTCWAALPDADLHVPKVFFMLIFASAISETSQVDILNIENQSLHFFPLTFPLLLEFRTF